MNNLITHNPARPLSFTAARELMQHFLDPEADAIVVGAGLALLGQREPSAEELLAFSEVLRSVSVPFPETGRCTLDVVGTGGDGHSGSATPNLSTLAALLLPRFGVTVTKHGNRAATGICGSADLLEELGYDLQRPAELLVLDLATHGFAFLLASAYHPQLVRLRDLRRRLGVPTVFNLLGPLLNPARPARLLLGVARPGLLEPMAEALAASGVQRAFVIHGTDRAGRGLDEAAIDGPTCLIEIRGDRAGAAITLEAEEAGLPAHPAGLPRIHSRAEAFASARALLAGRRDPAFDSAVADAVGLQAALAVLLERGKDVAALPEVFGEVRQQLEEGVELPFSPVRP